MQPQLIQELRAQRAKLTREAYIDRLVKETPVAINELALSKVVLTPAVEAIGSEPAAAPGKPKFK